MSNFDDDDLPNSTETNKETTRQEGDEALSPPLRITATTEDENDPTPSTIATLLRRPPRPENTHQLNSHYV